MLLNPEVITSVYGPLWRTYLNRLPGLGRGLARFHRTVHTGEGITDRNQRAALTLHALFSHAVQTP